MGESMDKLIIIGIGIAIVVCVVTAIIEIFVLKNNDKDSFGNFIDNMKKRR